MVRFAIMERQIVLKSKILEKTDFISILSTLFIERLIKQRLGSIKVTKNLIKELGRQIFQFNL